jgi:hypothetical protein
MVSVGWPTVGVMDIPLLRLAALRIAGHHLPSAAEAVRWLTALQAQDPHGAITSVALRTESGSRASVEQAFDAGEIVKSWPMRGTLHLVAAEDLPWILPLTTPRIIAASAKRRAELGLDAPTLARAEEVAVGALTGGGKLSRAELMAAWDEAGLGTTGQRGYHLLGHLAQTGTVCFGPTRAGEQLIVLVDEWIPKPRRPERDEALGELALRYFRGHGPATVKDFTRWTNLTAADARAGLAIARPELASVEVDGVEYLMAPETPDLLASCGRRAKGVFLLPGFDEFMLGYLDRTAALPAEYANRVVPGGNGVFQPTVISAGRVVGTWKRGRGEPVVTPFTTLPDAVAKAIPKVYATLALRA